MARRPGLGPVERRASGRYSQTVRIGVLTTSFPRYEGDVAGSFVLGLARELVRRDHTVEVLAPEPAAPTRSTPEPGIAVRHVRYLWPRGLQRTFYGAGVPDNLARDPRAWLGPVPFTMSLARQSLRTRAGWDAIVSQWALPCALVAASVRGPRPHVAVLHSADVHLLTRLPLASQLAARIARGSDGLWFVTQAHRERFLALCREPDRRLAEQRSWVAPMGIDRGSVHAPERCTARQALGLTRFSVLTLGRLVPVKGLDVLLRASAGQPWTVLIAGDGPERPRLARMACELGVDARFLGHVAAAEKRALLAAADVFVVPSRILPSGRSEGLPVAMLEAMAHELPIVASRVGGIAEVLPDAAGAGCLVAPDRPEHLASALHGLRSDPARAREAGMRAAHLAERYTWNHVVEPALAALSGARSASIGPPEITPTP